MKASMKIAVAGGTGRVGRHAVEVLKERGYDAVPMSRSTGVDLISGQGLAEALAGAEAIIDAATGPSPDQEAATAFFTTATRNLQAAGEKAGAQRIVVVSIIGTDKFSGGYGLAKVAHEQAMLAGPVPARILRAAQFHEFVEELMNWGMQGNVIYVPNMRTQLVAARTVAEALVDLATDPEWTGRSDKPPFPEIAGPREENLLQAARLLASRRGESAAIESAAWPGDPYAELYESGALLPGPQAILAGPTFEEWLEAHVPQAQLSR